MTSQHIKAIVLDIDGTLTPNISWITLTYGLGASVKNHTKLYEAMKNGELESADAKRRLQQEWHATGRTNLKQIKALFKDWELYPETEGVVAELKSKYTVCLLTGSFDVWTEMLAAKLRVDDWYANSKFVFDEQGDLVDIDYRMGQAEMKLENFELFRQKHGLKKDECVPVGDSLNDMAIFEESGNGIAVGHVPEALARLAIAGIDSIAELPEFLNREA